MDGKRKIPDIDIDKIVKDYQQGNEKAGEELLRIFGCHPQESVSKYIGKYYDLLRYGKMNFDNKELRRFISMFISDKQARVGLVNHYQPTEARAVAMAAVQNLVERFKVVEDEDLLQDLRLILIEQALRYEKQGTKKNFFGYIANSFMYRIKHYYKWVFADLLASATREFDVDVDNEIDEFSEIQIDDDWFVEDVYFANEQEELGFNWIHGKTTTFPFNQLSKYERTVLYLHDEKGMTDKEIAHTTGFHEDTIFSHRKKIKEKLRNLLSVGDSYER